MLLWLSSVCGIYWTQMWPIINTKVLAQQRLGRNRQIMHKMGCGGWENTLHLLPEKAAQMRRWTTFSDIYIPDDRNSRNLVLGLVTSQATKIHFSLQIGQFQPTRARDRTMRPQVDVLSSCWHQLVTEVPVGIWIRDKLKLKIDRSVKTPRQEYRVVAGSTMQGRK